ncbi:MAG: DUF1538 domain-containing protein [Pseudomonadota bacterium]
MRRSVRFGNFVREIAHEQKRVDFAAITAADPDPRKRLRLHSREVFNIIEPYVAVRLAEQLKAVVPLALYLALFQLLILRQDVVDGAIITAGLCCVIIGLMLFMEGLKVGLMPFGEVIGTSLPQKSPLPIVLLIALLLGVGVTFAEPAIGALKAAGAIVTVERAPYVHALLNDWSGTLVLLVGLGVGLAAVLGTLRFLYSWSLKPLIFASLVPTVGLTIYISQDPELSKILGLAWDAGAVTTGPVTVPLVLSLGIGIAASAGKNNSSLSGFGIVTLASLFPVLGVQALALYIRATVPLEDIMAAGQTASVVSEPAWYESTPGVEIVGGLRAIVPLVLFLLLVLTVVLREKIRHPGEIAYGITLCVVGMIVFNLGLSYGLAMLGEQSGSLVPAAFTTLDAVANSPLYQLSLGLTIAAIFAWFLGFGATLAEPALNALGLTVETLTNGAFRKSVLMYAVALGVGFGIAIGVLKLYFEIPMIWLVVPGYGLAAVLTLLSNEEFVNVAWDSAGVTTGPVTVPLVLAMGLGFGEAVGADEGFGILAMASIGPILAVLTTGIWIQWKTRRRHADEDGEDNA